MTKALFNTLVFEAASLAASALALVLGWPAIALLVFAASHLPGSLLLFPVLVAASALFDVHIQGGGAWSSLLPLLGAGVVVGVQVPLLIACFRWQMAEGGIAGNGQWAGAARSLGVFAAASMTAALVVVASLWLTPIRISGNCEPLFPGEPCPVTWQLNGPPEGPLAPFGTLRNDHFSTVTYEWWGLFEFQSPWRFAMLGIYAAIGLAPGLWIVARWRGWEWRTWEWSLWPRTSVAVVLAAVAAFVGMRLGRGTSSELCGAILGAVMGGMSVCASHLIRLLNAISMKELRFDRRPFIAFVALLVVVGVVVWLCEGLARGYF